MACSRPSVEFQEVQPVSRAPATWFDAPKLAAASPLLGFYYQPARILVHSRKHSQVSKSFLYHTCT